jgi:hypothetical protein
LLKGVKINNSDIYLNFIENEYECAIQLRGIIIKILSIQIDCPDKRRIQNI